MSDDTLDKLASKLRYSGYFLDVAAMPGADRIVAIDQGGTTHTWTLEQASTMLTTIKAAKNMRPAVDKEN